MTSRIEQDWQRKVMTIRFSYSDWKKLTAQAAEKNLTTAQWVLKLIISGMNSQPALKPRETVISRPKCVKLAAADKERIAIDPRPAAVVALEYAVSTVYVYKIRKKWRDKLTAPLCC